jgi:hypothetical protein
MWTGGNNSARGYRRSVALLRDASRCRLAPAGPSHARIVGKAVRSGVAEVFRTLCAAMYCALPLTFRASFDQNQRLTLDKRSVL